MFLSNSGLILSFKKGFSISSIIIIIIANAKSIPP